MSEKELTYGLEQKYYKWLTGLIPGMENHSRLIWQLYGTPFLVILLMDENRVSDGLGLRNRFVMEEGLSPNARCLIDRIRPCSVLEVMIALALRFNEEYMTTYTDEDPVGMWFWPMLRSLGIAHMDDRHFDAGKVEAVMQTLLNRTYSPSGRGSFFYVPGTDTDMRNVEIWRQMMMWYNKGGENNG